MGGLHDISRLSRHTADVGFSPACFLGGPFSVTSTQVTVRVGGRLSLNIYRYCHKSCSISPPCRKNAAAAASVRGLPPVTTALTEPDRPHTLTPSVPGPFSSFKLCLDCFDGDKR